MTLPAVQRTPRHPASWAERIIPLVSVALVAVLPLRHLGALPDPIAIHWGFNGQPDGYGPLWLDLALIIAATALVTLLPLWAAGRADRGPARLLVAVAHGSAAFFVLLRWATLNANAGASAWHEAGSITGGLLGVFAVIALVVGVLGWFVARSRPEHVRATCQVTPVPMRAGESAAWFGDQSIGLGTVGAVVALVVALGSSVLAPPPARLVVGSTLVFTAVLLATFTRIRVAIGPHGVTVRFGVLGWPRIHVPIGSIEHVEIETVEPMAYGGWGYRVVPGVRAVVIRRGAGLRIARRDKAALVVTVDDADTAASVLAAHLAARR